MEIKAAIHSMKKRIRFYVCLLVVLAAFSGEVPAQPVIKNYTIKNNKMYIALGKQMSDASIDSFTRQYNLLDLALKKYVRGVLLDSLRIQGWKVEVDNEEVFIISKPLFSLDNMDNPVNKILFTEKDGDLLARFPAVSSGTRYGYNRFRNKSSFASQDSVVTFYLRNYNNAKKVMLAGSFNEWNPDALAMTHTDSGWIAHVKTGPGKYWYKFVVDGNWMNDPDNLVKENDGQGNTNSVFFKTNYIFRLPGYSSARRVYVTGSFNGWNETELLMNKTATGWEIPVYLADGTHTYRFIADRRWLEDPANPDRLPNEFGEYNSVIRLGKTHLFYLPGFTDAKQVILSGSFNNWRTDELFMKKTDKGWELPYTIGPGNYEYKFMVDGKWAGAHTADPNDKNPGNLYFVVEPNHTFKLKGFENAKQVYLAGNFNNWSPNTFAMKKQGDEWVMDVHLSKGKHLYKFVVDGQWILDPGNKLWEQNEHNTGNSVIWIGR
ncbi:MAG: hypothetical protein JNK14_09365 [Chitinophagaceae bacterium]|nr:hypothetical protein [Chitinophagaceae bacterium]